MHTDPIADMLTRIRNAKFIYRQEVLIPRSKIKEEIVKKLKQEGFINNYEIISSPPENQIKVHLKYGPDGEQMIQHIQRVSTPGKRVYKNVREMKKVLGGLGMLIVSTPKGILSDRECREKKTGGEVICIIW